MRLPVCLLPPWLTHTQCLRSRAQAETADARALQAEAKRQAEEAHKRTGTVEEAQAQVFSEAMRQAKVRAETAAREAEQMVQAARRSEEEARGVAQEARRREEMHVAEARVETARWYAAAQKAQKEADGAWLAEAQAKREAEQAKVRVEEALKAQGAAIAAAAEKAARVEEAAMRTMEDRLEQASLEEKRAVSQAQTACDAAHGVRVCARATTCSKGPHARLCRPHCRPSPNACAHEGCRGPAAMYPPRAPFSPWRAPAHRVHACIPR
jgi:hypothetical protein